MEGVFLGIAAVGLAFLQGIVADRRLRGDLRGDDIILGWCSFPGQILFFYRSLRGFRLVGFFRLLAALGLFGGGVGNVLGLFLFDGLVCGSIPLEQGDLHHRKDRKARRQRQRDPGPAGGGPALPRSFSRPDGRHHTVGKPFRYRGIFDRWEGGPDGLDVIHIGPADTAGLQMRLYALRLRRRQLAVHVQVQQGRKFLTGIHLSALLS